ncbi:putative flagellar hook-associated protein 1 (HAP1, FlgK protein) [Bradyrhizobium sp. ORS 285]|uniref:flagellar hook-associated protein FlgK n=1 Tax=Bradyrhizobium sp. ORS 285 TaxID=115808 RepID=UPI0002408939|nr:flagellar hook-associated protein FlgK [Bradyrhizobium sp. ORS 285]CCD84513.1 putative flagellar hook-associated protein 1 (HAP1, FlgK protein) [Bradyrhizobium sp. ORS 285]SMX57310.1 putative flagellar hook-associated protein 1 (HAP1, FlgK protein) [Bradyrhizobium sp. ORS 285]
MGLSSALATAMSGLRSTQAALSIISSNVANANTPGYVAQNPNQIEVASGGFGSTVMTTGVNRQLDLFVQNQLRTETSGGAYANQMANILTQLQSVYGTPGGSGTLETALNNFTTALQSLSNNPSNQSAQSVALSAAQGLAQQLNATTKGIQTLRTNVEQDIGNSATQANAAIKQIGTLNMQLQGLSPSDPLSATLQDQRDNAIDTLSKYVDIRVVPDATNGISVFTNSGIQLVGAGLTSEFTFSSPGTLDATSLYNSNPTKTGVGQLNIKLSNGVSLDVVANNLLNSGQIAADLKLRDQTLVQAQTQADQLAATMSSALSDKTTAGTAVTGPPAGFDVSTTGLLAGNTINLTYTDSSNVQRQVKIVNVNDPAALPLQNATGANPSYVGVDFSLGMASVVTQLNSALGSAHLQFANPSGTTLRITDDGTSQATVRAASSTTTVQTLASGNAQLPLFTDGGALYTGKITSTGIQMTGLAGRLNVNPALLNDATKLSTYSTSPQTPAGDSTRPDFLFAQLTSASFSYSPTTGLGSAAQPFQGTVSGYLQQFVSQQGSAANLATQLNQGQSVVVSTLKEKFHATAGVNMDSEMSNLIQVQNTYAANAHIMSVVQSMMQSLLQAYQ